MRDLLYLNEGNGPNGRARFREVGVQAGLESANFSHGLGAIFTDYNGDGRPDLYVANDEDPNQLYENVPWPGGVKTDPAGLGFRFEERAAAEGVADRYAGMGIVSADYNGDGRNDLFVTNSRREPSAAYVRLAKPGAPAFANARPAFLPALGSSFAGWGASAVDLANSGKLDLVLAAGAIPITSLAADAEPVRLLASLPGSPEGERFGSAVASVASGLSLNGRGLAAADVDNDGRMDVAVNTIGGKLVLLRSAGPIGHWLDVKLDSFSPGALVTAVLPSGKKLVREVQAGSSYLSSEDPRVHFGLGDATTVRELVVRFPNGGGVTRLTDVRADRDGRRQAAAAGRRARRRRRVGVVRARRLHAAQPRRQLRRARLGRGGARRAAQRARRADRAGARSLPSLRGDVGRVGRVRPEGRRVHRQRQGDGDRRDGGPQRGDQLRGVPAPPLARVVRREPGADVRPARDDDAIALLLVRVHDARRATRRLRSATGSRPR